MDKNRYRKKIVTFCSFAHALQELSVCKRHAVGCVIFKADCTQILSIGYNGPASGVEHERCTGEVGTCGCIHAEINAFTKLNCKEAYPALIYCTVSPCLNCANVIANSMAIKAVIYGELCRHSGVRESLNKIGIPLLTIEEIKDEILTEWWTLSRVFR